MSRSNLKLIVLNVVCLIVALIFFKDSLFWIGERVGVGVFKLFNVLAFIALGVLAYHRINGRLSLIIKLQVTPVLPIVVMIIAIIGYVVLDSIFGIRTFNTLMFLFFLFGYVGLFVNKRNWLRSSVPVLLLTLILPFGDLLDTYLGFPLRMQTSIGVEYILQKMGVDLLDHQTILSLENRYTQIDTTCSGLNVIWAGTLLFIAFSIIDRIKFGVRWVIWFCAFMLMLLCFNGLRILLLVSLELVFENQQLADAIHVPLGLVGFVVPAIIMWFWVNWKKTKIKDQRDEPVPRSEYFSFAGQMVVIAVLISLLAFMPVKEVLTNKSVVLSESLNFNPIVLTEKEQAYFDFEQSDARKYHLDFRSLHGSVIVIASNSFKGHHDPTLCLQSIGFQIKSNLLRLVEGQPIRYLTFKESNQVGIYWFKSGNEYTDDYSYRVWYDIKNKNRTNNWIQVTALFDSDYQVEDLGLFFNYINKNINCNEIN
ncbi:MAG: exosortase O [Bacteroidetes bacterium]|nr:MAG: exosortase O [Bacteroidota bacterium]